MEDNIHPVVELLLARMKSNPEEFGWGEERWDYIIEMVMRISSDEERKALEAARRPIYLDEAHKWMMDELLNGEERRAVAERDLMTANRTTNRASQVAAIATLGQYQNAIGTYTTASSQPLEAMRIQANGELEIGGEKLDAGMIRKMKKALGL